MPELPETAVSTVTIILDLQPSCLEFSKSQDILVLGTYNLEPAQTPGQDRSKDDSNLQPETPAQKRNGSLSTLKVTERTVTILETKILPYGILDLHFSPSSPSNFAVATSVGSVCLFSLDTPNGCSGLNFIKSIPICDSTVLVLSLAYQTPDPIKATSLIAASLSNGQLAIFTEEQDEQNVLRIPTHSQEAWTVAWSKAPHQQFASDQDLYSGGDDCFLSKHNMEFLNSHTRVTVDGYHPVSRDSRTHGAGVTSIVVLPIHQDGQEILITGSYDENIRVLVPSKHSRGRAKVLAETPLGGGVWRISNPFALESMTNGEDTSFKVLASCMHAGARVLEIRKTNGTWSIKVLIVFTEHESMNYASDVRICDDGLMFVSTSFYDRKLCIWKPSKISV